MNKTKTTSTVTSKTTTGYIEPGTESMTAETPIVSNDMIKQLIGELSLKSIAYLSSNSKTQQVQEITNSILMEKAECFEEMWNLGSELETKIEKDNNPRLARIKGTNKIREII